MGIPVNIKPASVSFSSSGDNTAIAGTSGTTIRVYAIAIGLASAATVTAKDGASTTLGAWPGATSVVLDPVMDQPRYTCSLGNNFVINLGSSVSCTGTIWYTQL